MHAAHWFSGQEKRKKKRKKRRRKKRKKRDVWASHSLLNQLPNAVSKPGYLVNPISVVSGDRVEQYQRVTENYVFNWESFSLNCSFLALFPIRIMLLNALLSIIFLSLLILYGWLVIYSLLTRLRSSSCYLSLFGRMILTTTPLFAYPIIRGEIRVTWVLTRSLSRYENGRIAEQRYSRKGWEMEG